MCGRALVNSVMREAKMSKSKEEINDKAKLENEAREDPSHKQKDNYGEKMRKKLASRKGVIRKRK